MGYTTRVEGGFQITPPLNWQEIQASPFEPSARQGQRYTASGIDLELVVTEETVDTDEGPLLRRTAEQLVMPYIDEYRARGLVEQVQKCFDMFPDHAFTGFLNCEGEENADLWRVIVRDGRAEFIRARIVWPEGGDVR